VVYALEFWTNLAEQEAEMEEEDEPAPGAESANKRYVLKYLAQVTQLLFALMTKVEEDDGDDDFGIGEAAGVCLNRLVEAAHDAIWDNALQALVFQHFAATEWQQRDAATLALGIAVDGLSEEKLKQLVPATLPTLLGKLVGPGADPVAHVRDTTGWTTGTLLHVGFTVIDAATLGSAIQVLNAALDDVARVARRAALALHNIGLHMGDVVDEATGASPWSAALGALFSHMIQRADKEDWNQCALRTACYESINTIVEHGTGPADNPTLVALLSECVNRLNGTLQKSVSPQNAPPITGDRGC
jgi:hypothetical protein